MSTETRIRWVAFTALQANRHKYYDIKFATLGQVWYRVDVVKTVELCGQTNHLMGVTIFKLRRIKCGGVGEVSVMKKSLSAAGNYKGD